MVATNPLLALAAIASLFAAVAITVVGLQKSGEDFGHFGQGLFGIAGSLGFLVAVWLFYLQGSDKPRVQVATVPTLVPLMPSSDGKGRILLQVVNTISNHGGFPATYDCVAVDVRGLKPADALPRNPMFNYDVNTDALVFPNTENPQWKHCMAREEERWKRREQARAKKFILPKRVERRFVKPDSGYRYDAFALEAGESRTRDFELVIPCDFAAVRVHFVVPKPGNRSVNEVKTVVPLHDTCTKSEGLSQAKPPRARAARRQV